MIHVGDRLGCVTVLEMLEAAVARERDLRGYHGKPVHLVAHGSHAWVRCDCHLEFLVRARELSRRKNTERCGQRCELGREAEPEKPAREWTHCRNPLCAKELNPRRMGRPNRTGFCNECKKTRGVRRWYEITRQGAAGALARRIAHARQVKRQRRARGECAQCGVPCAGRLCEPHRAATNAQAAARRARNVRAGICINCRKLAVPGRSRCEEHLAEDAATSLRLYHRQREERAAA